jgi:serine/threonine protein kinase
VCEAMQFIALKGVVHRDLAARNVLLFAPMAAADPLSVDAKVSDFGLARAVYSLKTTASGAGPGLPVRYMSPEAHQRNLFTEKSDVWAFGVLLWEVATLGMKPYYETCHDIHVVHGVCKGTLRLTKPEECSDKMYQLMASCWAASPDDRPSFRDLRRHIQNLMLELPAEAVRRCAACAYTVMHAAQPCTYVVMPWRRLASAGVADSARAV